MDDDSEDGNDNGVADSDEDANPPAKRARLNPKVISLLLIWKWLTRTTESSKEAQARQTGTQKQAFKVLQ